MHIYPRVMRSLKERGWISDTDTVLVLAGGDFDWQSMLDAALATVTISNLEYHDGHKDYAPYQWKRFDAEKIEADENSYDWAVIHARLHHLAVPAMAFAKCSALPAKGSSASKHETAFS